MSKSIPNTDLSNKTLELYAMAEWGFVPLHNYAQVIEMANGKRLYLGKVPSVKNWRNSALNVADAMAAQVQGKNVGAIIPKGWVVLDFDPRNYPEGRNTYEEVCETFGISTLNGEPSVITGSGGLHIFYRCPLDWKGCSSHESYKGLDIKQHGGFVVGAGSIHPTSFNSYKWQPGSDLTEATDLPQSLLTFLKHATPSAKSGSGDGSWNTMSSAQVEDALSKLKADHFQDQDAWFGLMCSVHWVSGGEAKAEFISWSTSDLKYAGHDSIISDRWDSLGRSGASNEHVAKSGQLFNALKSAGYKVAGMYPLPVEKDFYDLLPSESFRDRERIDVAATKNDPTANNSPERKTLSKVLDLNREYFLINISGKAVIGREYKEDTGARRIKYSDVASFKLIMSNILVDKNTIGDSWLTHPDRRTYDSQEFDPSEEPLEFVRGSEKILNTWQGYSIEQIEGDWTPIQRLLFEGLCNNHEANYEYLLNWIAYAYQHPADPIGTAVVIRGQKGTGKGSFFEVFSAPFKSQSISTSKMELLFGPSNGALADMIAICINESRIATNRAVITQVQELITDPTTMINQKYLPVYAQKNNSKVVIVANDEYVVEATEDERRYFALEASNKFKNDSAFWNDFKFQMVKGTMLNHFFHAMMNRPLGKFSPIFDLPATEALAQQKGHGRGVIVDYLKDIIESGFEDYEFVWARTFRSLWSMADMWSHFKFWQDNLPRGGMYNQAKGFLNSPAALTRALKTVFGDKMSLSSTTNGAVPDGKGMSLKAYKGPDGIERLKVYTLPDREGIIQHLKTQYSTEFLDSYVDFDEQFGLTDKPDSLTDKRDLFDFLDLVDPQNEPDIPSDPFDFF